MFVVFDALSLFRVVSHSGHVARSWGIPSHDRPDDHPGRPIRARRQETRDNVPFGGSYRVSSTDLPMYTGVPANWQAPAAMPRLTRAHKSRWASALSRNSRRMAPYHTFPGLVRFTQLRRHSLASTTPYEVRTLWTRYSLAGWLAGWLVLWYRHVSEPRPRSIWHCHYGSIPADALEPYSEVSAGSPMHRREK